MTAYDVRLRAPGLDRRLTGTLIDTQWDVVFFPWTVDPRKDVAAWRRLAQGPQAVSTTVGSLDFAYGGGGPRNLKLAGIPVERLPGADHFGMIARTRLQLPAGRWRFVTQSDDGVRVTVKGTQVLENWTWHGPTRDEGIFQQAAPGRSDIVVEHFEIDGYSVLRLEFEPVGS